MCGETWSMTVDYNSSRHTKGILTILLDEINIILLSNPQEGVPIDELKKFCNLYKMKKIGLETNERFLEKEIKEIQRLNKVTNEWQVYDKIRCPENIQYQPSMQHRPQSSDETRNFLRSLWLRTEFC